MNQFVKTVLTGGAGTVVMTLGSQLMGKISNQSFSEPEHLKTMIKRLAPTLSKQAGVIAGWGAHIAIGVIFAAIYVELWEKREIKHTLTNSIVLGLLSGSLGALVWKATFKAHPLPPRLNYNAYYLQLIPAHIIFAVTAVITYRLIKSNETPKMVPAPVWNNRQAETFRRVKARA